VVTGGEGMFRARFVGLLGGKKSEKRCVGKAFRSNGDEKKWEPLKACNVGWGR